MNRTTQKDSRFLITGGHFTPALAVLSELQRQGHKDIVWVGRKHTMKGDTNVSAEYKKVAQEYEIPFFNFRTGKIIRFDSFSTFLDFLANLIILPLGMIKALIILLQSKPSVIISFGGHLAFPIVFMGKLLRIPSVTHEQTVVTGLANKMIARFVTKVLISWEQSFQYFDKRKTILTGNPIRKEVFSFKTNKFKVNPELKTIYITGGNQGAHIINTHVFRILEELLKNYNVIHQTGSTTVTKDYYIAQKKEKALKNKVNGVYIAQPNIFGEEIGEAFGKADIIVSRCGANTLTELLALGKMSVLIPIPWTINNEQVKNARMLKELGLAVVIEEKELDSNRLFNEIRSVFSSLNNNKSVLGQPLDQAITNGKKKIMLDADKRIVKEVISLL